MKKLITLIPIIFFFSCGDKVREEIIERYYNGQKKTLVKYKGEGSEEVILERLIYSDSGDTTIWENYNKNGAELLLGSKYSIINNLFAKKNNIKNRKSFNITFYNGGSGNILIYAKIIKLITKIQKKITINLVCGPFAKNTKFVISKYKKKRNIKIINKNEDFYKTLINTNLLVGSCGLISFEAAKIKLPSILFVMNENQKINKNTLEEIGHYFILDKKDIKNSKKVAALIMKCFQKSVLKMMI